MRWPPAPFLSKIVSHAGLPVVAASGSFTAAVLAAPKTAEVIVLGVVLTSAAHGTAASKIVESIWKRRRANIQAKSEARVLEQLTGTVITLVNQAAEEANPEKTELVKELLYQLSISPLLPPGRRVADQFLAPKLAPPKGKVPPKTPSGPPAGGGAEVLDFRRQPTDTSNPGQPPA
jgi:hypothetical protein